MRAKTPLQVLRDVASFLIPQGFKMEVPMHNQPTSEELTATTPAFGCIGFFDYDDDRLGCEAMIGELSSGIGGCWQKSGATLRQDVGL
jgi:hypothetical protein